MKLLPPSGRTCLPPPGGALVAADFCQVIETSDVPGGVINILTGDRAQLARTLAEHDDVAALWYFGPPDGAADVERASAGNLKATWCRHVRAQDWYAPPAAGREFLRRATQVKNIWIPYGE